MSKLRQLHTVAENPEISRFISMMQHNRSRLLEMLKDVDNIMIDFSPDMKIIETIGTILEHIAGVAWSWIFVEIDKKELEYEKWKYGYPLRYWSKVDGQRQGAGKKFYLDLLEKIHTALLIRLKKFNDEDLKRVFEIDNLTFSLEYIFYHLINHEAMHIGQISLLKRLFRQSQD